MYELAIAGYVVEIVLVVENEGNLVCPAEFKVGEDVR